MSREERRVSEWGEQRLRALSMRLRKSRGSSFSSLAPCCNSLNTTYDSREVGKKVGDASH